MGSPLLFIGAMVWFSPLPWQVGEERNLGRTPRAVAAFVVSELYVFLYLCLDFALRRWAGAPTEFLSSLATHASFYAPCLALVGGVLALRERLDREKEEARAAARESQSRALQGQLNPHVLFNALNGLAELMQKSPAEAERSIRHLSDLLRKVLVASEQDRARLSEERALLEDYLDMERLRLGARLSLSWDWDREVDRIWMPPLLLQPLVENAIKHGIAPSRSGGELNIQAKREGNDLRLAVRNTGQGMVSAEPSEGVGLRNLRARLGLCFGPSASFSIRSEEGWTVAEIQVRDREWKREAA